MKAALLLSEHAPHKTRLEDCALSLRLRRLGDGEDRRPVDFAPKRGLRGWIRTIFTTSRVLVHRA
jgi:hypothetical protein